MASTAMAAYLGEDVEMRKLGGRLVGTKGVFPWGFTKKLPPCVFVEQLVAGLREQYTLGR
jgi:hypothetical protein